MKIQIKHIFILLILIFTHNFLFGMKVFKTQLSHAKKKTPKDFQLMKKKTKKYIKTYCEFLRSLSEKPKTDVCCYNNSLEKLLDAHFWKDDSYCDQKYHSLKEILDSIDKSKIEIVKLLKKRVKKKDLVAAYYAFMKLFTENKDFHWYDVYPKRVEFLVSEEMKKLCLKFLPVLKNLELEFTKPFRKSLSQKQKDKDYVDIKIIYLK